MKQPILVLMLIMVLSCSVVYGQEKKEVTITKEEQQAITEAFTIKQQTQAKVNELKKLKESLLQPIDAAIRQAETEDANAFMQFQNIELKIGNAHGFDPLKFDRSEKDGKLIYVEKKKDATKEGK